ncbi:unnamed protein product, partial [Symbiodinium necroappetens]
SVFEGANAFCWLHADRVAAGGPWSWRFPSPAAPQESVTQMTAPTRGSKPTSWTHLETLRVGQLKKRNGLVITMADSTGLSEK